MKAQSCIFTINFPSNDRIRNHLFELEDHLDKFQKPFTLLPLPADAPVSLPRILAISVHGHSQLQIFGNNAQITTNFDDNYKSDISKCIGYVRDMSQSILEAVAIIEGKRGSQPNMNFSGVTLTLVLDTTDGIEKPLDFLADGYVNCKVNLPLEEVQSRCAFAVKDKYYVNIMLQNIRDFFGDIDNRASVDNMSQAGEYLQVVLDVNDRYIYNKIKNSNYSPPQENISEIFDITEKWALKYIKQFIKEGKIEYNET